MWARQGVDVARPPIGFANIWVQVPASDSRRYGGQTNYIGFNLPPMFQNRNQRIARTEYEWEVLDETDAILKVTTNTYGPMNWQLIRDMRTVEGLQDDIIWNRWCKEHSINHQGVEVQYFLVRIIPPDADDTYTWDLVEHQVQPSDGVRQRTLVCNGGEGTAASLSSQLYSVSKKRPAMETLGMLHSFCVKITKTADRQNMKICAYCMPIFGYDASLAKAHSLTLERRNLIIENYPNSFARQKHAVPRAQKYVIPEVREEYIVKVGHLKFTRVGEGSNMLLDNTTLHLLADWSTAWPGINTSEEMELSFNPNHRVNVRSIHEQQGNDSAETCMECDSRTETRILPAGYWIISPNHACEHWYNLQDSQYTRENAQYNTRCTLARLMMAIDVKAGSEDMVRFNVAKTSRITKNTGFGMDDGLLDRLSF